MVIEQVSYNANAQHVIATEYLYTTKNKALVYVCQDDGVGLSLRTRSAIKLAKTTFSSNLKNHLNFGKVVFGASKCANMKSGIRYE